MTKDAQEELMECFAGPASTQAQDVFCATPSLLVAQNTLGVMGAAQPWLLHYAWSEKPTKAHA